MDRSPTSDPFGSRSFSEWLALARAEPDQFEKLFDEAPDALLALDPSRRVVRANVRAEQLFGYERHQLEGQSVDILVPQRLRQKEASPPLMTEEVVQVELPGLRLDGRELMVEWCMAAVSRPQGPLLVVAIRDRADIDRALEALRQSEERFRLLVEGVKDYAIFMLDPEGKVATWNQGAERLKGYRPDESVGSHYSRFYTPEDRAAGLPDKNLRLAEENGRLEVEGWRLRKDGTRFWADVIITALKDAQGNLRGFAKVTRDLTERRAAEENERRLAREHSERALAEQAAASAREQARRLRVLAEASRFFAQANLDFDKTLTALARFCSELIGDGCTIHVAVEGAQEFQIKAMHHQDPVANELGQQLIGPRYPQTGAIAKVYESQSPVLIPELDPTQHAATAPDIFNAFTSRFSVYSVVAVPIRIGAQIVGVAGLSRQTPGRSYTEDDLALLQDLADRAGLAMENARLYRDLEAAVRVRDDFPATASHELKTPLTALLVQIQSLLGMVRRGQTQNLVERLNRLDRSGMKLGVLVEQLLNVSRLASGRLFLEPEPFNLTELVREVVERFSENDSAEGPKISLRAVEQVEGVWDRFRIEQVVTNLLGNAIKYGQGKPVEVEVSSEGDDAVLRVTDHGIGVEPAFHSRIFEQFERATNSRAFSGLGLGLWISRQIVEASGGRISMDSTLGQGSTFEVRLSRNSSKDHEQSSASLPSAEASTSTK